LEARLSDVEGGVAEKVADLCAEFDGALCTTMVKVMSSADLRDRFEGGRKKLDAFFDAPTLG
jgi:hypothetical protein